MKITIEYDTEMDDLNDKDKEILRAITGDTARTVEIEVSADDAPVSTIEGKSPLEPVLEAVKAVETVKDEAPATTLQVDNTGLPWDERIHSTVAGGGGKLTKAGVWARRRGVDDLKFNTVAAELRGESTAPAATEEPAATGEVDAQGNIGYEVPPNGVTDNVAQAAFGNTAPAVTQDAIPGVPSTPETNEALTPEPSSDGIGFAQLSVELGNRVGEKPEYQQVINQILSANNIAALPGLLTQPHLIPVIKQQLDQAWGA